MTCGRTAYADAHAYTCTTSCLASLVCLACLTPGLPDLPRLPRSLTSLDYCAHAPDCTESGRDNPTPTPSSILTPICCLLLSLLVPLLEKMLLLLT